MKHFEECPFCKGFYWHTYNNLENKLLEISNIIIIDKKNFDSYGEGFADLLVLIGNAIDSFFRKMFDCPNLLDFKKELQKNEVGIGIKEYRDIFEPYYEFSKNKLSTRYGLGNEFKITPFSRFNEESPSWWIAYNKVKHEYYDHIQKANLRNTLNALGGLFLLNALHLCSSYYLANHRFIDSFYGDYDAGYRPASINNNLLRSKIGSSYLTPELVLNTKLFNFIYRTDKLDDKLPNLLIEVDIDW